MTRSQLFAIGAAVLTAVLSDAITYLQARRRAQDEGKPAPGYQWERLAEKVFAGLMVGLGSAGLVNQ